MRRAIAALAVLLAGFIALTCIKPPAGHGDFNLRMNEIDCVLRGVNPFSIWSEEVVLPPYVSNIPRKTVPEGCTQQVNAYAPWEYSYMMPIAWLPKPARWPAYCLLMGAAVLLLAMFSFPADGRDARGNMCGLSATVPFIVMSYLIWSNTSVGNFIVFVMASSVLMAHAISRGQSVLAALLWALAMIKPQSAILFAVSLLMRKKLGVCVVAGATCLAASLPAVFMCNASLLDLLLQGPAANAELFQGCGTWPKFLCGHFGNGTDIGIGLAIGAGLCAWMTWMLRREKDWLVYLMPAAICGSCWTYTQSYSHAMGWFVVYAIVSSLLRNPRSRFLWILLVVSLPVLSRVFLAWSGFCAFFGLRFPMSEYAFRCVDSLNSTASLAIAVAFCLWRRRELDCDIICPAEG